MNDHKTDLKYITGLAITQYFKSKGYVRDEFEGFVNLISVLVLVYDMISTKQNEQCSAIIMFIASNDTL